jgi:hypothetical protein
MALLPVPRRRQIQADPASRDDGQHANGSGRAGQVRMVPYPTAAEAQEALALQQRVKERGGYCIRSFVEQGLQKTT